MSKLAFILPGQGSQTVGMGRDLAQAFPEAKAVFDEVDAALNEPFSKLVWEGPEEKLKLTANTQPAILTTSVAVAAVLKKRGVVPAICAGHSLGEYSALVIAGALGVADAARAVRARGTFMQEAVPAGQGAMAAVLGLPPEKVKEICAQVAGELKQVCAPANFNEPGQTVIAGAAGAVERAGEKLKEAGAKRVLPLPVSAPFHCALMAPVQPRLAAVLDKIAWKPLAVPVVSNVEARANKDVARVPTLLVDQVTAPVRWIECVEALRAEGATRFLEVGPGRVLSGLVKRIDKAMDVANVEDMASLEKLGSGGQ
jgi:[acyl-carrier-protein] S-malonyltransferase